MRIEEVGAAPFEELRYLSASTRGRPETFRLPLLRARASGLPSSLAGLLLASDLQGVAPVASADGAVRPAGEALAERLPGLEADGLTPPLGEVGVLLGGDLYAEPSAHLRGATGDVRDVWRAFAAGCRWVAGVGGNHDLFGASPREQDRFRREPGVHLLDGEVVELDGLRIGGVSGIAGDPSKAGRRDEAAILEALGRVMAARPDLVVLHEGPACGRGYPGSDAVADLLRGCGGVLVVCGHVHWPEPLASLSDGVQVVNVTERVLLVEPARRPRPT